MRIHLSTLFIIMLFASGWLYANIRLTREVCKWDSTWKLTGKRGVKFPMESISRGFPIPFQSNMSQGEDEISSIQSSFDFEFVSTRYFSLMALSLNFFIGLAGATLIWILLEKPHLLSKIFTRFAARASTTRRY